MYGVTPAVPVDLYAEPVLFQHRFQHLRRIKVPRLTKHLLRHADASAHKGAWVKLIDKESSLSRKHPCYLLQRCVGLLKMVQRLADEHYFEAVIIKRERLGSGGVGLDIMRGELEHPFGRAKRNKPKVISVRKRKFA